MIDIHAHILPGIDDGAVDFYDMLEMAQIAVESGVKGMVATPHCNIPGLYRNYYSEAYVELFQKAEAVLKQENIPLTLYAGMEVFLTEDVPKLLYEGKILTINGSHYMLSEFDFDEDPDYVDNLLTSVSELGITPVIAHAERYKFVQRNLLMAAEWQKRGYVIQVNKGSIMGRFGRKEEETAFRLLDQNLVSAIASDAHGTKSRTPYMLDAYMAMAKEWPTEYLKILFEENPMRICKGLPVIELGRN